MGLEGFVLPPEEEALALRYIRGEIELDEYLVTPHRVLHER